MVQFCAMSITKVAHYYGCRWTELGENAPPCARFWYSTSSFWPRGGVIICRGVLILLKAWKILDYGLGNISDFILQVVFGTLGICCVIRFWARYFDKSQHDCHILRYLVLLSWKITTIKQSSSRLRGLPGSKSQGEPSAGYLLACVTILCHELVIE